VESDTCGGQIVLAARSIAVTPSGELFADVVDRTYAAAATSGTLVAEGDFPASTCRDGTLHERWAFARAGTGGDLQGVLVSEWPVPGACSRSCSVVIHLLAVREE
jgi:hypothetical protein